MMTKQRPKKATSSKYDHGARFGDNIVDLELSQIVIDENQDRLPALTHVNDLYESMLQNGLLTPIIVAPSPDDPNKFRLVAGHRRVIAATKLGWNSIRAVVRRFESERDLLAVRVVENIDRLDLNPMEQAIAVEGLLAEAEANAGNGTDLERREEAICEVATRLGRPVRWVRDRDFLASLNGMARQLVMDGVLPIAHAREICKLARADDRDDACNYVVDTVWGSATAETTIKSMDQLRSWVRSRLQRLDRVNWKLDAAFAGQPACSACHKNSSNAPGLFDDEPDGEYGGLAGVGPVCRDQDCFNLKTKAVRLTIDKAAKKAASHVENPGLIVNGKQIKSKVPNFVLEHVVTDEIKTVLGADASKLIGSRAADMLERRSKAPASKAPARDSGRSPKTVAKHKHIAACRLWLRTIVEPAALKRAEEDPVLWFRTLAVLSCRGKNNSNAIQGFDAAISKANAIQGFDAAISKAKYGVTDEQMARIMFDEASGRLSAFEVRIYLDLEDVWQVGKLSEVLELLGVKPDKPEPKLEDFMPKAATEPAKSMKPAGKPKTTNKTTTKKKTSKKAPRSGQIVGAA